MLSRLNVFVLVLVATLVAACTPAAPPAPTTAPAGPAAAPKPTEAARPAAEATPTTAPAPAAKPASVAVENVLYAFAPGRIAIIEPKSAQIVKEITDGLQGIEWGDPVATKDHRLIFVNDRANAQVVVIDTAKQAIVKRIDVGPRPVHIYNPLGGDEIWTHSDEEGAFYVIDAKALEVKGKVVAALKGTGHGKLLYHKELGSKAYATNTNDPAVFVLDLEKKQVTKTIDLCDGKGGTHGKAYSALSKHAYFECSDIGKMAVVDTTTDTLVKYLDGSGQIFTSPDEKLVLVVDKRAGQVHVIDATKGSEIVASIPVEGGPDKVYFHQQGGKLVAFTANTLTPDVAVLDLQAMKLVKRIAAGDIKRPEGARFFHRGGEMGGGFFFTPASGDGVVAIIDATGLRLHAAVPVKDVAQVAYVGAGR